MEELLQDLIATLHESLLILDLDLRVQVASRSFYGSFQVERDEVENRYLYELGNGQWDIPPLRAALQEVVTHCTQFDGLVIEHHFPHIGPKTMLLNARRVVRAEDAVPLILLAMNDITEVRQAATIKEYLHKLEWSNRELQDFAYVASHDLQEPLRTIQAFSERLQSKHASSLNAQGQDYLARIQKAAGRMSHLISDLLTYSHVTTQGKPFEHVKLTELVQECIADLAKRLEDTGGSIDVGTLPTLEADSTQIRQLMQNLLDNGLKFHREGQSPHVKIVSHGVASADFATPPITEPDGKFCYISVRDNGIGFEEKYIDRIFAPFERLHTHSQYPGTGIGLAVCRRIVERHGGTLTARSVPDEGTTFFIVLPLKQPHQSPPTGALPPRPLPLPQSQPSQEASRGARV